MEPRMFQTFAFIISAVITVSLAIPITRTQEGGDDPNTVAELNHLVDVVLANVRTSKLMTLMDPRTFPHQHRAVEHGSYNLYDGTAIGLSTISRQGDSSYVRVVEDQSLIVTVTVATRQIQAAARMDAITNSGENFDGKIFGTLEPLEFVLQFQIQGGRVSMTKFNISSHLHLFPETFTGKTEGEELRSILQDAMYYGFGVNYGMDIGKVVSGPLKQQIGRILDELSYPTAD